MALAGLIRRRGSTVTIRRATRTRAANGTYAMAWADVTVGARMLIEPITSEISEKVWGQEKHALARGLASTALALALDDGVTVTAGDRVGERYRVVGLLPELLGGSAHLECGLATAVEAFA